MNQAGAGEGTQLVKSFLRKCEDLSLDIKTHVKSHGVWDCDHSAEEGETCGVNGGLLVTKSSHSVNARRNEKPCFKK